MRNSSMWLFVAGALCLTGCSVPWTYLRTVDPYTKTQAKEPYAYTISVSGGARLQILKFYVTSTKTMGCAVLKVDNSRAEAKIYVNPHKAQFVAGKVGVMAMKSTVAAREIMFRKMAADYFKLNSSQVSTWSQYHFQLGTVKPGKTKEGLICFHLGDSLEDPRRIKLKGKLRMRLTGLLVGNGPVDASWIWLRQLR